VTEGEDKPLKYPVMFRKADLVLITKIDLIPHLPGFDLAKLEENLALVMPDPRTIRVSSTTGEGIDAWLQWMRQARARMRPAVLEV
jgi:hydrogenase nickel incorporation protein HypB